MSLKVSLTIQGGELVYLNNVEIKALRNVLVENRVIPESAKILRTALAKK